MARAGLSVSAMPQFLYSSARVGWTSPFSSVHRDWITASCPSQAQSKLNRVCALGRIGACSLASFQLLPPSVETSTLAILPPPDWAKPGISSYRGRGIFIPAEDRVMTDFGAHSKWYQRDLPSMSSRMTE